MSDLPLSHTQWISRFHNHLSNERYANGTVKHRVAIAREFLSFLEARNIDLRAVRPNDVEHYLQQALRKFRQHRTHPPHKQWRQAHFHPICVFLRFVLEKWPPAPRRISCAEEFKRKLCDEYADWMASARGLSDETILLRLRETRRFLSWLGRCATKARIAALTVADIDRYVKHRSTHLQRSSIGTVASWTRALLRWLHINGQTGTDLSTVVMAGSNYQFEKIPPALAWEDVKRVLAAAGHDRTAKGIRDYAILMLLSQYGMRAGEIARLRLEDIDWRQGVIRVRHSKTQVTSHLPLFPQVGDAILNYLQKARPKTSLRHVFLVSHAPYRPFKKGASLNSLVRDRIDAAGVLGHSRRGPHAFRHARAVSLLRAAVPLKEIGDVLGHRSSRSTMIYLKLATEDFRAIALEIPAEVSA